MNTPHNNKLLLIIIHSSFGLILWKYPVLGTYLGLGIVIIGTYNILTSIPYRDCIPLFFSAYVLGLEVLLRMTNAKLFWEFGKYSVVLFLFLGLLRKGTEIKIHLPIVIYFILLLPSIINVPFLSLDLWRQDVSFNLSGPICLLISSIYFFNTKLKKSEMGSMLFYALLPIFSMVTFIYLRMPSFELYHFLPYSNPITSGGYGPNQVSSIFGFALAVLFFSRISKLDLFGSKKIEYFALILFLGFGLITFSRGGILSSIIAILISLSYTLFHNKNKTQMILRSFILFVTVIGVWLLTVEITDGMITQRYGVNSPTYSERFLFNLSGRVEIYLIDLKIFFDNIITGVGPGQAFYLRSLYGYGTEVAAHIEYTRMLAEHGILGFIALIVLFLEPIKRIYSPSNLINKNYRILFSSLSLLTMFHTALRIVMPCFIYGIIFADIED